MSLDQVEVVTKLLRASRNCDEPLLKDCFKEILENGITGKDLNSTDKSGRVSQPYGCFIQTLKSNGFLEDVGGCFIYSRLNRLNSHPYTRGCTTCVCYSNLLRMLAQIARKIFENSWFFPFAGNPKFARLFAVNKILQLFYYTELLLDLKQCVGKSIFH